MIAPLVEGRSLRFPGHEITWAGECPWTGGFCFGTETGELLICPRNSEGALDVLRIKVTDEAINGVAFRGDLIGISTRGEVSVNQRSPSADKLIPLINAPGGAHGIAATPGGRFFAPMGTTGLLRIDPSRLPRPDAVTIDGPGPTVINFYKAIYLENPSSQDLLACAARTSGLLKVRSDRDNPLEVMGLVSPNVDFIDICSVQSTEWPFAVVGLSLDRSLIFVRDLLAERSPQTLHLGELRGTPYSILNADGCLVVLTSKELVAFPELLSWYPGGEPLDRPFRYRYTPMQAVDAYVAYGKHLMVVMDEEVRFFETPSLLRPSVSTTQENGHPDLSDWAEREQLPTLDQPNWAPLSLGA